jgi:Outer membrane lipoprotein-sorting protein
MFRLVFLLVVGAGFAWSAEPSAFDRWIARQAEIRTLSADFTQSRALRVLRNPVAARGHLWYQAPGNFRWQVGDPPKIIVLRKGADVRVIEPAKKTVKIEALEVGRREAGLMEFPFARSRAELEKRFAVADVKEEGSVCRVKLLPRDTQGFLAGVQLAFNTENLHLLMLEMSFRDGSSVRSEFSNIEVDGKLPAGIFAPDTTGYQVIDASR